MNQTIRFTPLSIRAEARETDLLPLRGTSAVEQRLDELAQEIERRENEARARAEARVRFDLD
jgi:hypothetical protein